MSREQYQGTVVLLIIGGNDTTRNTISGSVYALNKNPDQYAKLRADPALILPMVSETIRWQTPLAHMSRVATRDVEVGGKTIKKGDRVVMWYISGNRDESVIANPDAFIIDRERPRQHLSFGFGIHRCVGNRVAEMQLTIIWEEILKRFPGSSWSASRRAPIRPSSTATRACRWSSRPGPDRRVGLTVRR